MVVVTLVLFAAWAMREWDRREARVGGFSFEVTEPEGISKALSSGVPAMIDFGSHNCAPCREMAPELVKAERLLRGRGKVVFADVWKNPQLAGDFPLRVIPTQFFFNADGSPMKVPPGDRMGLVEYRSAQGRHVYTLHEGPLSAQEILELFRHMGVRGD